MIAQLASALAHVHSRRIVHRDIKSSNVFLRAAHPGGGAGGGHAVANGSGGGRHHLLLGDFGVAKALESTKAMACTMRHTILPPSRVCNGLPTISRQTCGPWVCRVRGLCS